MSKALAERYVEAFPLAKVALDAYLEFTNDYLSYEVFSEHKGISVALAEALVKEGREIHKLNDK